MTKILAIGSITKDIFFPTNQGAVMETPEDVLCQKKISFELGAKYHINGRQETLGGCSINVACGLAKLGIDASCYAPIGDDVTGQWARKELNLCGVDTDKFKMIPGVYSDLSAIIVDENSGDRTIFSSHSASEKFEIEKESVADAEWIFISDLSGDWRKNLDEVLLAAKEKNMTLVFNPRQKALNEDVHKNIEAISLCKMLFVNKDEAIEIISQLQGNEERINSEEYLIKELKKLGPEIVVVTDGIRGAWGFNGKQFLHVDAIVRKAVDTTGAGDAFASGFIASHVKGNDLATSLKWGIANSSNSVTEYGGQKGLLGEKEIKEIAEKVNIEEL